MKLKVGDRVLCQYFNEPEHRFYGDKFEAVIVQIIGNAANDKTKPFCVARIPGGNQVWMHRKEIREKVHFKTITLVTNGHSGHLE
jgi:hypothetical protein